MTIICELIKIKQTLNDRGLQIRIMITVFTLVISFLRLVFSNTQTNRFFLKIIDLDSITVINAHI